MAIQNKTLSGAEHDWFATQSGLPSKSPLGDHKTAVFAKYGVGGTGKPISQMEREWLQKIAGSSSLKQGDLWREAVSRIGLTPSVKQSENQFLFFTSDYSALYSYINSIPNLVAYYPLNEASGNAINQAPATLGTLGGTVTGATYGAAGQAGKAYTFDGSTTNVHITDPGTGSVLDITSEFSIVAAVNLSRGGTGAGAAPIVIKGLFSNARGYNLNSLSTRALEVAIGTGAATQTVGSTSTLTNGTWYAVGCSYSASATRGRIYINGTMDKEDTSTLTGTLTSNNSDLMIGSRSDNAAYIQGTVQHVALFNRELTATEFQNIAFFLT